MRIALTFPEANGGFCRVFRIDREDAVATAGLACKAHEDWTVVALGEARVIEVYLIMLVVAIVTTAAVAETFRQLRDTKPAQLAGDVESSHEKPVVFDGDRYHQSSRWNQVIPLVEAQFVILQVLHFIEAVDVEQSAVRDS